MKPVLILQHLTQDGPAYLQTWLQRAGVPAVVVNSEAGETFPDSVDAYAALAVLGGEMSANDDLPSLRQAERLILDAMAADRPVLGHCLGGQLMARALGATVAEARVPEIGWHKLQVQPRPASRAWFGDLSEALVFQWHYDAFALPAGAQWLACSDACAHQAFSIGPHLAMQFHVELDSAKLRAWATAHDPRFGAAQEAATVQSAAQMLHDADQRLARQQELANRIYERWLTAAR